LGKNLRRNTFLTAAQEENNLIQITAANRQLPVCGIAQYRTAPPTKSTFKTAINSLMRVSQRKYPYLTNFILPKAGGSVPQKHAL
jgi:hypothetical protein